MRQWGLKNPEKIMLYAARNRAKTAGIECTITEKDIIIPETCPILGLTLEKLGGRSGNLSPSLDRVDNNKGYTPDNVCVISQKANQLNGGMSIKDMEMLFAYMWIYQTLG
jgi:hypothetical protein